MTFSDFTAKWCDTLPEATGDYVTFLADRFLQMSGQASDPASQRRLVDQMRQDGLYHQSGYGGQCCLRIRPYARG